MSLHRYWNVTVRLLKLYVFKLFKVRLVFSQHIEF